VFNLPPFRNRIGNVAVINQIKVVYRDTGRDPRRGVFDGSLGHTAYGAAYTVFEDQAYLLGVAADFVQLVYGIQRNPVHGN